MSQPPLLDPRLNACRGDLADERLHGLVAASRFTAGRAARVIVGCAPLHRAPASDAPLDSFCHYGEAVRVFETAGGYAWCQSGFDAYVGYVPADCLALDDAAAPTHFVVPLGAHLYAAPDLRSRAVDLLPRHSAVVIVEAELMTRGTEYVRLDRGGYLPLAGLSPTAPRSPDIVAAAELYLGCPYLWGGRSALGLDCSGLVQSACRDLGIAAPRDTDMQRDTLGEAVAVAQAADLRRGDLLYLPGHVLIDAGDGNVIHADGATMTVRHDRLADWMRGQRLDWPRFAVRRLPAPSAG